jgi:DNA polymerase
MGLRREQVYIANVLKCRPPGNRDPQPQEVNACEGHLESQILTIQPRILVALGRPAACWLTGLDTSLARMRGQEHHWRGIPVIATYHPAFLLRQERFKAHCWQDLQRVIQALDLDGGRTGS